jgi:hypothetical protein
MKDMRTPEDQARRQFTAECLKLSEQAKQLALDVGVLYSQWGMTVNRREGRSKRATGGRKN